MIIKISGSDGKTIHEIETVSVIDIVAASRTDYLVIMANRNEFLIPFHSYIKLQDALNREGGGTSDANPPNYSMEAIFEVWFDSFGKDKNKEAIALALWYPGHDDAIADFLRRINEKRAILERVGKRVSVLEKKLIFLPTKTEIKLS